MTEENDIHTHVVFVTAFIQKGNKFLLAKRSKSDPQAGGMWSTPGGKVDMDVGENIVEITIKREVMEEVGLTIEDHIEYLGSEGFIRVSGHHVVGLIFLARWKSGIAKPLEDQEKIAWYTIEELSELSDLPNYFKARVKLLASYLYYTKANTTTVRSWMKRSSLTEGETVRNKYPDRKVGDIYSHHEETK